MKGIIDLYLSVYAVTDTYYIANRALKNKAEAKNLLMKSIEIVLAASVSENEIIDALALPWEI